MNLKKWGIIALIIVAWVWIPTGTPDDLVTTVPIIHFFGWNIFWIVTAVLIFLLWRLGVLQKLLR